MLKCSFWATSGLLAVLLVTSAYADSIQMLPPVESGTASTACASSTNGKLLSWDGATPIKCQNNIIVDSSGNVGVGTTSISAPLTVGNSKANGFISIGAMDTVHEGAQIDFRGAGSHDSWHQDVYDNVLRFFSGSSNNNFVEIKNYGSGTSGLFVQGSVGVGTTMPAAKLDVAGGVKVGDDASCTAAKGGTVRYNSGVMQFCNGSVWAAIGGAPTGPTAWYGSGSALISSYTSSGPGCASTNDDAACPAGWVQVGMDICGATKVAVLCQKY